MLSEKEEEQKKKYVNAIYEAEKLANLQPKAKRLEVFEKELKRLVEEIN